VERRDRVVTVHYHRAVARPARLIGGLPGGMVFTSMT
jgi:hypothetical protein